MYLQEILEVAIGMVFIWFVISLCAMTIQEWVVAKLNWRATDLESAIRRMIEDPTFDQKVDQIWTVFFRFIKTLLQKIFKSKSPPKSAEIQSIFTEFMDHPQIRSLSKLGSKPSYISKSKFSTVMLDIVMTAGKKESIIQNSFEHLERDIQQLGESDREPARKVFEDLATLSKGIIYTAPVKKMLEEIGNQLEFKILEVQKKYKTKSLTFTLKDFPDYKDLETIFSELDETKYDAVYEKLNEFMQAVLSRKPTAKIEIIKKEFTDLFPEIEQFLDAILRIAKEMEKFQREIELRLYKHSEVKEIFDDLLKFTKQYILLNLISFKKDELLNKYSALKPAAEALLAPSLQTREVEDSLYHLSSGAAIIAVKDPRIRIALNGLINDVQGFASDKEKALAAARTNLETYFNDSMDRLGGIYKRRSQVFAFVVGVMIAVFVNVDSLTAMEHLWREPTLRQAIVAQAEQTAKTGAITTTDTTATKTTEEININELEATFHELNLPIGWVLDKKAETCSPFPNFTTPPAEYFGVSIADKGCLRPAANEDAKTGNLFKWLIGILITGAAAAQGAPFWFDILGKLVNVRSTGIKPKDEEPAAGKTQKA